MPEYILLLASKDGFDEWRVLQKCLGDADYYVTIATELSEAEARKVVADLEAMA